MAFFLAALILAITPGPGMAYVVARTAAGGRAAGLASCVGTGLGGLFHVCAAALGLSLLLAQSAAAFSVVKYVGATYLLYLGIRLLLSKSPAVPGVVAASGARRALLEGIMVEALNVKTALFFLAFLPQFLVRGSPAVLQSRHHGHGVCRSQHARRCLCRSRRCAASQVRACRAAPCTNAEQGVRCHSSRLGSVCCGGEAGRLTHPSSERAAAGFACLRPQLTSNVRQHKLGS